MEITQIKDCQNILKIGQALETEEERKCDELFRDKNTIEWLKGRKSNLDKVIEETVNEKKIYSGIKEKLGNDYDLLLEEVSEIPLTAIGKLRFLDQKLDVALFI